MNNLQTSKGKSKGYKELTNTQLELLCYNIANNYYDIPDRLKAYYASGYKKTNEDEDKKMMNRVIKQSSIRNRISYMRQELFNINKADEEYIRSLYQKLIDDPATTGTVRILAIEKLSKLCKLLEQSSSGSNITLVFNGTESNQLEINKL